MRRCKDFQFIRLEESLNKINKMNKLVNFLLLPFSNKRQFKACLHFLFFGVLFFTHSITFANSNTNCTVDWTTSENSITITGLSAPHVIFKLFTPEWKTHTNCFDNCSDRMTIKGLREGATYHVSYNLYDANWKLICKDLQDVVIEGEREEIENIDTGVCGFLNLDIFESSLVAIPSCTTIEEEDSFTFQCPNTFFSSDNSSFSIDREGNFLSAMASPAFVTPQEFDVAFDSETQLITISSPGVAERPAFNTILSLDPGPDLTIFSIISSNARVVFDGFFIAGTLVVSNPDDSFSFLQYTATLDFNGNINTAQILGEFAFGDFIFNLTTLHTTRDGYVFEVTQSNLLSLIRFDLQGNFIWRASFAGGLLSAIRVPEVDLTADEQFAYTAITSDMNPFLDKINLITGETIYSVEIRDVINFGGFGPGIMKGVEPTADGGVIVGYQFGDTAGESDGFSGYSKLDASGNLVWSRRLEPSNCFVPVFETSDGGLLFLQRMDGFVSVLKTDAMGEFLNPDCEEVEVEVEEEEVVVETTPIACDLDYRFSNSDLSISGNGLNEGHVIVKVFDPSWKTIFSCQDDCGTTINLEGLKNGSYHVNINLYDSKWRSTCRELVRIDLGADPSNFQEGSTKSITSLKAQNASSIKVYPNPANGLIYIDLNNSLSTETTLQIRDQLGSVHISEQIDKDTYTIPVSIEQLENGLYWLSLVNGDGVITTKKIVITKYCLNNNSLSLGG